MTNLPQSCYRVSVNAIIFNKTRTKLLLFKEAGKRVFPGGLMEHGTTVERAMTQEIKEASDLDVVKVAKNPTVMYTKQQKDLVWESHLLYEVGLRSLNFTATKKCEEK